MKKNQFTLAVARKVLILVRGESQPSSSFPSWLAEELWSEGLVTKTVRGSHAAFRVREPNRCLQYIIENYTDGLGLGEWIEQKEIEKENHRNRLSEAAAEAKASQEQAFRGFLINSCEKIEAELEGESFVIAPSESSALLIQDPKTLSIPADVTVVGVESGECFRHIRRLAPIFGKGRFLFVARYPQLADLREWLIRIPNAYLHFGNFDLAGLYFFQIEYFKYLGARAAYFIPDDIEQRLKEGDKRLYEEQQARYANLPVADARLAKLFQWINQYGKGCKQEDYLR